MTLALSALLWDTAHSSPNTDFTLITSERAGLNEFRYDMRTGILIESNAYEHASYLSPDATQIAVLVPSGRDYAIHLMEADGSNRRVLATVPAGRQNPNQNLHWTSDGRYLFWLVPLAQSQLLRIDTATGAVEIIIEYNANIGFYEYREEQSQILSLIISADFNFGILHLYDITTGTTTIIENTAAVWTWHDSGSYFVYAAINTETDSSTLMQYDVERGIAQAITPEYDGLPGFFVYVPHTAKLLYTIVGVEGIFLYDPTTGIQQIAEMSMRLAHFSPDGQAVLMTHFEQINGTSNTVNWYVIDLETYEKRLIANDETVVFTNETVWSPDSRRIAFLYGERAGTRLEIYDATTGALIREQDITLSGNFPIFTGIGDSFRWDG